MDKDIKGIEGLIQFGIDSGFIKKAKPMVRVWDYRNNRVILMSKTLYDRMLEKAKNT